MVEKYFGGKVPSKVTSHKSQVTSKNLEAKAVGLAAELERTIPQFDFTGALSKIWEVINLANKFIEDSKPWALAKEKKEEELSECIYTLLEILRIAAISIYPFMPDTAKNIWAQLGMKEDLEKVKSSDAASSGRLETGKKVNKANPLFPRIETQP